LAVCVWLRGPWAGKCHTLRDLSGLRVRGPWDGARAFQ